ncbi:MAG: peptidoglycan DD-metalloendopeptidase family protein [Candidatus Aminicenantes bacterium]|nr:peptidoglycan DD-metalloendopeptidase family protein [Candidatus Aminicenantes bacterium]
MKKVFLIFLLFIYLNQIYLLSLHEEQLLTPSGVTVELLCRAYESGEVIVVTIKDDSSVKDAWIRFLGRRYAMGKSETSSGLLAFIGLDLDLKSGSYDMEIFIDKELGEREHIKKQISVLAKEFPLKKLWVDEKFVTPPPEFHERIRREREFLEVIYGISTDQWLGKGLFILPSSGEATPNFGERRIYNNKPRSSHRGIDIIVPYGTPVSAANSGKVVLASDLYFAGKTVIIDHGMGVFTLYCHFSKIRVKRGKLVRKGEIVGEIGATGRVTGPHLHWGVKVSGISVNPFSILSLTFE